LQDGGDRRSLDSPRNAGDDEPALRHASAISGTTTRSARRHAGKSVAFT
jgi:hypothetical protein